MKPVAAVFDCDGVLLESAEIKTDAFAALFSGEAEHLPAILALHERHAGISRTIKFEWIYRDLLKRPYHEQTARALEDQFATFVWERILSCPLVPGALALLDSLARSCVPCFVASGTPEAELRRVLEARGLGQWFAGIHGSPLSKAAILGLVADQLTTDASRLVFIGDALTDSEAAREVGSQFIGRVAPGRASPFPVGTRIVPDLTGLATDVISFSTKQERSRCEYW